MLRGLAAGRVPAPGATDAAVPADTGVPLTTRPFLVASLPEYWRHHWGTDIDTLVEWGVGGFEIWTSSPRGMDFPPALRRQTIARCQRGGLAMFGATDMHGFGYTASVWNVARLRGWRTLDAAALGSALVERFHREGTEANRMMMMRRWLPETAAGAVVAVPGNLVLLLRTATPAHSAALLAWIWLPAVLTGLRRRAPKS